MTGPRDEILRDGTFGPLGVQLLYTTVRQVARMRNLPPPPGSTGWDPDAVAEVAHEFLADRGQQRILDIAIRSTDEDSFRAMLWSSVLNHVITLGRRTERGRLSERLKDVLAHVGGLIDAGGVLRMEGTADDGPVATFAELVYVAARVPVTVPAWSADAARRAPVADRDSLVALISEIVAASPGGVTWAQLVAVVAVRLEVHDSPLAMDLTTLDAIAPPSHVDPAQAAAEADAGERLMAQLSINEQRVLPYLDESTSVISASTGLGRTKAWETASVLRSKLAGLLHDDPSREETLRGAIGWSHTRWYGGE